jgi:AcrR family transcriptional regulator
MNQKVARLAAQDALLEAAKSVLRERGYAALSTREVAMVAGMPLSQIHYHFGSKQGLVLALFEYLDAQLLDRQQALYSDPALSLADQWDRACAYLDDDLASGYVRVMHELAPAG